MSGVLVCLGVLILWGWRWYNYFYNYFYKLYQHGYQYGCFFTATVLITGLLFKQEWYTLAWSWAGSMPKTASERRGNNLKRVQDFDLKAKARIWP